MSTYSGDAQIVDIFNISGSGAGSPTTLYTVPTGQFIRVSGISFDPAPNAADTILLTAGGRDIINQSSALAAGFLVRMRRGNVSTGDATASATPGIYFMGEIVLGEGETLTVQRAAANFTVELFNKP